MCCYFSHCLCFAKNLVVVAFVVMMHNGSSHHNAAALLVVVGMMTTLVGKVLIYWKFSFLCALATYGVVAVSLGSPLQCQEVPRWKELLGRVVAPLHSVPLPDVRVRAGLLCRILGTKGRDERYLGEARRLLGLDLAFHGLQCRTSGHRQAQQWHLPR